MASRTIRRRATYRALGRHSTYRSRPVIRLLILLVTGVVMLTSGASAATIFFYGQNLPTLQHFKARFEFQNTLITDFQGQPLQELVDLRDRAHGKRVIEPLQYPGHSSAYYRANHEGWLVGARDPYNPGIPVSLQNATIATEDASFYTNPGFDPFSIARAGYENFTQGHVVSGASTITQQLVRNSLLDQAPTLSRKTEEIVLAAELTQKYQKSKILWYYLNSVPYGNLAIGAEAASEQYFHRHVWQLNLPESALLAGLPEAPSIYNPVNNLPAALNRMRYVLHLMYKHGYLKGGPGQTETDILDGVMAQTKGWKFLPAINLKRFPHFVQYAIDQLQSIPQLKNKIYNGLIVQTTLDSGLQQQAQHIVSNQINQLSGLNVTDGALVSIDLRKQCYGCIRAMVGSADYQNKRISGQINMADRPRQPGSSFKPFNYVYGFQHGLSPGTTVYDGPVSIPDPGNPENGGWYQPTNYDHLWHGLVTLRTALANSLNIPAVKVEQYNASTSPKGLHAIEDQAIRMGIKSLPSDNPNCCGWSLTLGGMDRGVRLVEETAAYGTFGTYGMTVPPLAVWRVWDRTTHKLIYSAQHDAPDKPQRVLDPAFAYVMTSVLSDNAARCAAICEFGLDSPLNLGRPAAAKTGTTNGFTDNWTVGYTPDLVTGVWVGNANNTQMVVGTTGVTGAAPIWHDYMRAALAKYRIPPKPFWQPPSVYAGTNCILDGPYTSYGSMGYDVYAGGIPHCSVGVYNTNLPTSQNTSNYVPPAPAAPVQPAPAPVQAAPAPAQPAPVQQAPAPIQQPAAPVQPAPVPTRAVVAQPPPAPVQPPGVQPVNPAPSGNTDQIPGVQPVH